MQTFLFRKDIFHISWRRIFYRKSTGQVWWSKFCLEFEFISFAYISTRLQDSMHIKLLKWKSIHGKSVRDTTTASNQLLRPLEYHDGAKFIAIQTGCRPIAVDLDTLLMHDDICRTIGNERLLSRGHNEFQFFLNPVCRKNRGASPISNAEMMPFVAACSFSRGSWYGPGTIRRILHLGMSK